MRVNEPITDREIELPDNELLVSRTDPGGRITFVNRTFTRVCGYSEEELMGAPHNIIRHPHMPPAAFADLWATIKSGRPWEGLVKNRAKNGDFYWVRANATPEIEGGRIVGYISIRSKPSREQVAAAEAIYREVREGNPRNLTVKDGAAVPTGWRYRFATAAASLTGRLTAIFIMMTAIVAVAGWVGLAGINDSNEMVGKVYNDRAVPAGQLGDIIDRMRDNLQQMTLLVIDLRDGNEAKLIDGRVAKVRDNIAQISEIWGAYSARPHSGEEKDLADRFAGERGAFVKDGLLPALEIVAANDPLRLESHYNRVLMPLFQTAHDSNRALMQMELKLAGEDYAGAKKDFQFHLALMVMVVVVGAMMTAMLGRLLLGHVRKPLLRLENHLDALARSDFNHAIEVPAAKEFHEATHLLRALRARLAYAAQEREERERKAEYERGKALEDMASTVERESGQAVNEIELSTSTMAKDAEGMSNSAARVSGASQGVAAAAEQALANAQAVASATEELAASIREITSQVSYAGEVTKTAVTDSERTHSTISSLSTEVNRIGEIATLINDIAAQTNLLALNATIEAARAGDAGKGFAVVANEVKHLASQTAKATDEITAQITKIMDLTQAAVTAVSAVSGTIGRIDEVAGSIAQAMEEQSAATHEISRNVVETSSAAHEVAELIAKVSSDALETGEQAAAVRRVSAEVATSIHSLRQVLVRVVRTSTREADRRIRPRVLRDMACEVVIGGQAERAQVADLSVGGASIRSEARPSIGQSGVLRVAGMEVRFDVHNVSDGITHVKFNDSDENCERLFDAAGRSKAA